MTMRDSITAAIKQIDEKKEKLKKAFDELQPHRSLLSSSFKLSWSDIDAHFSTLQSSLLNRFHLLQSAAKSPVSDEIITSKADTKETPVNWPELRTFCEKMDGKGLGKFMIDHSKKRMSIYQELPAAIRCSPNPAALVLDAIEGSYHCSPSSSSARPIDGRRVFVLLLEALIEINVNLTNDLRERARTLAYDWKLNIGNKPSEALVFLNLVAAFELGSVFKTEELDDYIFMISKYQHATSICKKIGLDRNRFSELIHKLVDTGRLLVAIRFIYEFEMTDIFKPVSILKSSLKNSREAAKRVCAQGNNSLKAQNEATDRELSALRAVIKVVKERNLESEFSQEKLEECLQELENQKAQRNPKQPQKQQVDNNKRPRVAIDATSEYIPMPSLQQPLLPDPNPYGFAVPYGNQLTRHYGSAQVPVLVPGPQHLYHEHQSGYGVQAQYHPPYYPQ